MKSFRLFLLALLLCPAFAWGQVPLVPNGGYADGDAVSATTNSTGFDGAAADVGYRALDTVIGGPDDVKGTSLGVGGTSSSSSGAPLVDQGGGAHKHWMNTGTIYVYTDNYWVTFMNSSLLADGSSSRNAYVGSMLAPIIHNGALKSDYKVDVDFPTALYFPAEEGAAAAESIMTFSLLNLGGIDFKLVRKIFTFDSSYGALEASFELQYSLLYTTTSATANDIYQCYYIDFETQGNSVSFNEETKLENERLVWYKLRKDSGYAVVQMLTTPHAIRYVEDKNEISTQNTGGYTFRADSSTLSPRTDFSQYTLAGFTSENELAQMNTGKPLMNLMTERYVDVKAEEEKVSIVAISIGSTLSEALGAASSSVVTASSGSVVGGKLTSAPMDVAFAGAPSSPSSGGGGCMLLR